MVVNPYRSAESRPSTRTDFCQMGSSSSTVTPTTGRRCFSTRLMVLAVVICLFLASYIFHVHHNIAHPSADLNPPKLRGSISEDFKTFKRSNDPVDGSLSTTATAADTNSKTDSVVLTEEEIDLQKRTKTREQLQNHNQPSPFLVQQPVKPSTKPTASPTAKPTTKPTSKPTIAPTLEPTAAPTVAATAKVTEVVAKLSLPETGSKPSISIGNRAQLDQMMKENVIEHINSRKQHFEAPNPDEAGSHPVIDVSAHLDNERKKAVDSAAPAGLEKIDYNSNKVINEPPAVEPLQLPKGASVDGENLSVSNKDAPPLEHNQKVANNIPLDHRQKPEVAVEPVPQQQHNAQEDHFIHDVEEKVDRHREVIVEEPLHKSSKPQEPSAQKIAQPPHQLPPKPVHSRTVDMPVQAEVVEVDNANVKPATSFDIPAGDSSKLRTKSQLVATQPPNKEKIDYCATQEDPFAGYSVDTFRPPPAASFEAALEWRTAVKDMIKKISKLQIGGSALRERIQSESDKLKILRFKLFCKYA